MSKKRSEIFKILTSSHPLGKPLLFQLSWIPFYSRTFSFPNIELMRRAWQLSLESNTKEERKDAYHSTITERNENTRIVRFVYWWQEEMKVSHKIGCLCLSARWQEGMRYQIRQDACQPRWNEGMKVSRKAGYLCLSARWKEGVRLQIRHDGCSQPDDIKEWRIT